jgi:hypothetical protein
MGLTIGLTGHTKGFGKHIMHRLLELGYTVEPFSRANGVNLLESPNTIFNTPFDILINNTEVGNAQVILATTCANKGIPCINIGSKITEASVNNNIDIAKKDNKIKLEHVSKKYKQSYLTWGFTKENPILNNNPQLLETITVKDAVKEVINELESLFNLK